MKMLKDQNTALFKGPKQRMRVHHWPLLVALTLFGISSQWVWAQSEAPPPPPIREPLPPKVVAPEDTLDQEVVIRQEEGRTVEEYRRGGQVHMVRIVPAIGQPYYLLDTTGDGLLDMKHDTFEPVKPVYWRLIEW
ncbi:MAG: DUF2782 domain-containing protein [Pseudomonadota bacterium]